MTMPTKPKAKPVSVKAVARKALNADKKARLNTTLDSFTNFAQMLGIGTGGPLDTASYGFNPITRIRTLMEWIHRGSWLGGVAVDVIAEDMTREGVEIEGTMEPEDIQKLHKAAAKMGMWSHLRDTVAWARLYGGCLAVILIDGQDSSKPLRQDTIGPGQFKGLLVLDRWMVEPSLNNLVTELGPHLGLPKFYTVTADAPALPRMKIHYSRCIRLVGVKLPYWQRVMENLWGISVLERVYDRMVAFDSASTGAAQLVYKAFIRTYKIKGLRQIVSQGGAALAGLTAQVNLMRQFQNTEGITLLDGEDEFEGHSHSAFAGLSDALTQFGQQVSGALQVPLVRLFGQSPAGFSTGDADLRNYYDGVKQKQKSEMGDGVDLLYRILAASEGVEVPEDFGVGFKSLWQLTDEQKAAIAGTDTTTIIAAQTSGIISIQTALRELKQSSRVTGRFTNITEQMINDAEDDLPPSAAEMMEQQQTIGQDPDNPDKGPLGGGKINQLTGAGPKEKNAQAEAKQAEKPKPDNKTNDAEPTGAGILFKASDKYLLLLRSDKGDHPGEWCLPGGHIEDDETAEATAYRECDEETGAIISGALEIDNNGEYVTFEADIPDEFIPNLNDEHTDYKWVTQEQALELDLHPGVRELMEAL